MSSLLGLDYSDDEEEGQTQTPAQTTTPATATPAPAAAPAIAGLAAYADDSDEEEATPVGALAHGAAAVAAVVPAVAPLPVPTSTAPLRPSASLHTIATPSSSLHAPTDRHAPASGVSRSSSVNDVAALSSAVAAASSPPPIAPELLALLPPLPSGPLAPALAARHKLNLARQHAQSLNPRALPLVASLVANKSFHNPYILQRIADQLRIDQYGTNIDVRHWTEQNLDGRVEDDYIEIKRQAKEAVRICQRKGVRISQWCILLQATHFLHPSAPVCPPCPSFPDRRSSFLSLEHRVRAGVECAVRARRCSRCCRSAAGVDSQRRRQHHTRARIRRRHLQPTATDDDQQLECECKHRGCRHGSARAQVQMGRADRQQRGR